MLRKQQKEFVKMVGGLPPDYLKEQCHTDDQVSHLKELRTTWGMIALGIQAYFCGESIEVVLRERYSPGRDNFKFAVEVIQKYLLLYEVLNFGWVTISDKAEKDGYKIPVSTPGDALKLILRMVAESEFSRCKSYYRLPPQSFYRDYKKCRRLPRKTVLSNKEKKDLRGINKRLRNNGVEISLNEGEVFKNFCLEACLKKGDKKIKSLAKKFLKQEAEIQENLISRFHPSKRNSEEIWNRGIRQSQLNISS